MGDQHNVVSGQGCKVNRAKSTLSPPSIIFMRHREGEESVLLVLLTLRPCPETTLWLSPIAPHPGFREGAGKKILGWPIVVMMTLLMMS